MCPGGLRSSGFSRGCRAIAEALHRQAIELGERSSVDADTEKETYLILMESTQTCRSSPFVFATRWLIVPWQTWANVRTERANGS